MTIARIEYDGPGNDVEVYDDSEYVELRNGSGGPVDLGGWSLTDAKDHLLRIPSGFSIPARGTFRVYTGAGDDVADGRWFAGRGQAVWNNSGGDTAVLRDDIGAERDSYSYDS